MSKILNFNNDETIKKELNEKIQVIANDYITTITEFGMKLYGERFVEIPEYREMCSNMFFDALNTAIYNINKFH